jgi:hypothetical protein
MGKQILRLGTGNELLAYLTGMSLVEDSLSGASDGGTANWVKLYGKAREVPEVKAHIEGLFVLWAPKSIEEAVDNLFTKE